MKTTYPKLVVYVLIFCLTFLFIQTTFAQTQRGPETYWAPLTKRVGQDKTVRSNRWFPIGWAAEVYWVRGLNNPYGDNDRPARSNTWADGSVWDLQGKSHGNLNNTIIMRPLPNYPLRGFTDSGTWEQDHAATIDPVFNSADSDTNTWKRSYVRFLDTLEDIHAVAPTCDFYGVAPIAAKIPYKIDSVLFPNNTPYWPDWPWDLFSSVQYPGWFQDGYIADPFTPAPNPVDWVTNEYPTMVDTVNTVENHSRLAAWSLTDEPYGGGAAQSLEEGNYVERDAQGNVIKYWPAYPGFKSHIHNRLVDIKNIIVNNDSNTPRLPIFNDIRSWRNYYNSIDTKNLYMYAPAQAWLNMLDVTDYLMDNKYPDGYRPNGSWLEAVYKAQSAMDYVVQPSLHGINGYVMWAQGGSLAGSLPTIEELRYTCYAPWIMGAQGAMFYDLTISDANYYAQASAIQNEAWLMRDALLEPDPNISVHMTASKDVNKARFILRPDPDFSRRYLLMICNYYFPEPNNSGDPLVSEGQDITITFDNHNIETVYQINLSYNWSYALNGTDSISVGMGSPWARAFWVRLEDK